MRLFTPTLFLLMLVTTGTRLDAQYQLVDAFPNLPAFSLPVEMRTVSNGTEKIFIVEQRGRIYAFDKDSSVTTRKLFLDISDIVSQSGGETGLLGLAFHPDYAHNGYFFVDFTSSREGNLRSYVSRFQVSPTSPDSALHSSELIIIAQNKPFDNHNGGNLVFGPDGYLYINWGDGGSAGDPFGNAQNLSSWLGKILRIDVDSASGASPYSIPPSNPFAGGAYGALGEIYAYGLRNPWRMSFDRVTGTLWVGDVGQDTWEEVDTITPGGNYGWNRMEGYACYNPQSGCDTTGLIMPLLTYGHNAGDKSITGGYVYRGSALPGLYGRYIYADYESGRIWEYIPEAASPLPYRLLIDTPYFISSFGEDRSGELYILSYQNGRIYRISAAPTSITKQVDASLSGFVLEQNYPNPLSASGESLPAGQAGASGGNSTTTIRFHMDAPGIAKLSVYDVLGRRVAVLLDGPVTSGDHEVSFGVRRWTSGIYFYKLQYGNQTQQRSMTVLK